MSAPKATRSSPRSWCWPATPARVRCPSLQEVLLARVVRLGDRTQQLLRVAAAAGPGVAQPLLAAVAGVGEAALLEGLHEAVDQQVLRPEPGGQGYVFRHALVAEAVYSELLPGERVGLHGAGERAGGRRGARCSDGNQGGSAGVSLGSGR
jgi:predicted ATPase